MPDRDILHRAVPPGWVRPYRLLLGNATPVEVATATVRAVARSLRRGGGLPGTQDFAAVVHKVASGELDPAQAPGELRRIEQASHGHRHAKVAAQQAVARLIVEVTGGASLTGEPEQIVAERFCEALVDHALLGRVRADLVGKRFATHDEAVAWEQAYKEALQPGLRGLAKALARDPTGRSLRAPRARARVRRSTADILHEPIAGVEGAPSP